MMLMSFLLASALTTSQGTGSLAGCIKDSTGQALRGATVIATGESLRHTTEANAAGCYEIKAMAPGAYRVTARLQGFTNVTRDKVNVAAGPATALDLTLTVSPICECVRLSGSSLADLVKLADAVVHLRILGPQGGQSAGSQYYQHAAAVLHALKGVPPDVRTIPLLQNQMSGAPLPYDVDDEMLAFLRSGGGNGYSIINDDPGLTVNGEKAALVFRIRDGQVLEAPKEFSKYVGATVDAFLYELRQIAGGR